MGKDQLGRDCLLINGSCEIRWIFALYKAAFIDVEALHYLRNATQHILDVLQLLSSRVMCFAQTFGARLHCGSGMDAYKWAVELCCGIVASSDYLATTHVLPLLPLRRRWRRGTADMIFGS